MVNVKDDGCPKNGFTPSKIQDRLLFLFYWKFASEFLIGYCVI